MALVALAVLAMAAPACKGSGPGGPSALDGSNAAIVDWSDAAYDSFVAEEKYGNPMRAARVLAMVHLAQHDALVAIRPSHAAHAFSEKAPDADPVAAAASAAFEVLVAELPGQRTALAARLARSLEPLSDVVARGKGVALGQRAAAAMLQRRRGDGSDGPVLVPFTAEQAQKAGPGSYRPIPPADFLAAPSWRSVLPFGMQSPQQFRVGAARRPWPATNTRPLSRR